LDTLFPKTRQAVLSAFLLHPDKWWYLSDVAKHLGVSPSSLQRELASLVAGDLLARREDGNRVYYRANEDCPIIKELQAILVKTVGIADVIRSWLQKFDRKITIAFIYGSVARAEELSTSDVDLLVIGDVRLAELAPGLRRAEKTIEREVNPTIYSLDEYVQQHRKEDSFVKTVLSDSKIFLKGNEGELEALAR
jgi:predicted nucleotidyltransferase